MATNGSKTMNAKPASMKTRAWARKQLAQARALRATELDAEGRKPATAITWKEFLARFKAGRLTLRKQPRGKDRCACDPTMETPLYKVFDVGTPYEDGPDYGVREARKTELREFYRKREVDITTNMALTDADIGKAIEAVRAFVPKQAAK